MRDDREKRVTCPDCAKSMIGVQYCLTRQDYDGVSEWECNCGTRIGRWSKQRLRPDEMERRYGGAPISKAEGGWQ